MMRPRDVAGPFDDRLLWQSGFQCKHIRWENPIERRE